LARRIAARRKEQGISVAELATAAGIDPGYLAYFERSADANLSGGTLLLIALALDTSPRELLGGTSAEPLGRGRARPHASLNELTREQCQTHLSANGVGRVVYTTPRGPVALPVNYEFTEGQVVFSTDDAKAATLAAAERVGFEVDRVDDVLSEGWSVLVTGSCRRVEDPDEMQRLASLGLEPWAGGDRHELMAISPTETTGRVIVHEFPPDED
jgi:hypothetical protein